jgi:hypothetical protein
MRHSLIISEDDLRTHFQAKALVQSVSKKCAHAHRFKLASKIMQSVPYCNTDSMGLLGAQKCIFPLRTALTAFEAAPGRELARCCEVYSELFTRRKVRFARDLAMDNAIDANLMA